MELQHRLGDWLDYRKRDGSLVLRALSYGTSCSFVFFVFMSLTCLLCPHSLLMDTNLFVFLDRLLGSVSIAISITGQSSAKIIGTAASSTLSQQLDGLSRRR